MFQKIVSLCYPIFLSFIMCAAGSHHSCAEISDWQSRRTSGDQVTHASKLDVPFQMTAVTAPTSPTVLLRKVTCNYIVPVNDYVSFSIPHDIEIPEAGATKQTNYNSIMVTFEVAPTVPVFVWLQEDSVAGTATTPIYVNQSSTSVVIPYYTGNTWFELTTATTMGYLCIQGIYPTPPPETFYYPISCTIVYQ